jgi:uncharacterized protein YlxW (UPF0749 family)
MISRRAEWIGMLTSVCVVLGGLLALTVKTQLAVRAGVPDVRNSSELAQAWDDMQRKIITLQKQANEPHDGRAASGEDDRLQMLAAMDPVVGPGVEVTLDDNPQFTKEKPDPNLSSSTLNVVTIHDFDLLRVVNELFAAGAEAIAINGQRCGPRTAIRCAGATININQVPTAGPFHIMACGDPATLQGALNLPGGPLQEFRGVGCIVNVQTHHRMSLPAYDGAVTFHYARRAPPSGAAPTRPSFQEQARL